MDSNELLKKKIHSALKLSGFNVRREFCTFIVDKLSEQGLDLKNNSIFETMVKSLCSSLETRCISEQSIEKHHIEVAVEACLHSEYDSHETVFNVINAFDFPKLSYNVDRKMYSIGNEKSVLLADANVKSKLFLERYYTVLQRTRRNFMQTAKREMGQLQLQTVDYLLTSSEVTLEHTLILGSLLQVCEGKYYLEDPSGIVQLDLAHARYHGGFFVENSFVLANGYYEDKILHVSTVILPPGEEYKNSRPNFGNVNYFGGNSNVPLKDSQLLKDSMIKNEDEVIVFFSDVWLDHPVIYEKLEILFDGYQNSPPVAFVFMGNFMSTSYGSEMMNTLRKLFKRLAELILKFSGLINKSNFVFVPGLSDPCMPHMVPRLALPKFVTEEMGKILPNVIFATNPCRIQYCTREIVVFRADIVAKLLQSSLHKPPRDDIPECVTRTIISQGHLSPLSLNTLTVHWDFDYCLRLFPLPDLVIIGDKSEAYQGTYKECQVVNPGCFCDSDFQFKAYYPSSGTIVDCSL